MPGILGRGKGRHITKLCKKCKSDFKITKHMLQDVITNLTVVIIPISLLMNFCMNLVVQRFGKRPPFCDIPCLLKRLTADCVCFALVLMVDF